MNYLDDIRAALADLDATAAPGLDITHDLARAVIEEHAVDWIRYLLALLEDVAGSGAAYDYPERGSVEIQIDRAMWDAIRAGR